MKAFKERSRERNSELIESFLNLKGYPENYEVWVPIVHHGIVGFIDLVIEGKKRISLFKFTQDAKSIEKDVKNLKLEGAVFPECRNTASKEIKSYLVVSDNRKNRNFMLSKERILGDQSFEVLLLNEKEARIETFFDLKYSLPRIFQSEGIKLEKDALHDLISKPNHEKIESAILNLEEPPEVVTKDLIRNMNQYMKSKDTPPKSIDSLREFGNENRPNAYPHQNSSKKDLNEIRQS